MALRKSVSRVVSAAESGRGLPGLYLLRVEKVTAAYLFAKGEEITSSQHPTTKRRALQYGEAR